MISVIMSTYDENKEWVSLAIESILNQTYKNFEFIITIDKPDNQEIIKLLNDYAKKDKRIKIIKNEVNHGLVWSLNNMLKNAKGEYIARMDADDISLPNRFEEQLKFLQTRKVDLCGSLILSFNDFQTMKKINYPSSNFAIRKTSGYINCMAHPTYFARKVVFEKLNGYKKIPLCEDYDFLCRAIKNNYKLGNIKKVLLHYRINDNGISMSKKNEQITLSSYVAKWYRTNNKEIDSDDLLKYFKSQEFTKNVEKTNKKSYFNIKYLCKKIYIKILSYL